MKRDELERRLAERIADGHCQMSEAPIEVFEEATEGEARVTCTFSPAAAGLRFRLDKMGFPFLRRQSSVDWLVLVHLPDGSTDAHLIECKTTVGSKQWLGIKGQMASSVVRARAIAGALDTRIRHFHCYTAYRHDRISAKGSPAPILARPPVGPGAVERAEPEETREARRGQLDWEANEILLEGVDAPVPHRRIPLDPGSGIGQVELVAG